MAKDKALSIIPVPLLVMHDVVIECDDDTGQMPISLPDTICQKGKAGQRMIPEGMR